LGNIRQSSRRIESEEQKRLRREAQGIIRRIKQAEPEQVEQLQEDAEDISKQLKQAIESFEQASEQYQTRLKQKRSAELQSLLIEAKLQAEIMQRQREELDVAYIMMMIAAHV
jgi:leucyl aminopeptidase